MSSRIQSVNDLEFKQTGKVFPSPRDWRDQVIYFLLVDRFDNNAQNIPAYDPDTGAPGIISRTR